MEEYCNEELSFIWKTIYQTKLVFNDDHVYDKVSSYYPYDRFGYCETTLEAWLTRYPNFMFYFQNLDLDCNDGHLEFYIAESSNTRVTGLEYDVCGQEKPTGVFTVYNKYMRIKYIPKRRQYISSIFAIIITSFGKGSCPSYGHVCDNGRCIDGDLACNGYDSCGDGSGCELSTGPIVDIIIGSIVGVGLIISLVVCCICCRRRGKGTTGTVQSTATTAQAVTYTEHPMTSQPMYGMNQGSSYPTNMPTYPVSSHDPYITHPQINGQVDPSAPPPSYDEITGNENKY